MHDLAQPGIVFACEELCDALRDWPCIMMMTAGVDALPPDILASVLSKMREFKDFTSDNDPHGEHDFGALEVNGHQIFFKIDYYDLKLEYGSKDPADPTKTTRVLTLMLATEYSPARPRRAYRWRLTIR